MRSRSYQFGIKRKHADVYQCWLCFACMYTIKSV